VELKWNRLEEDQESTVDGWEDETIRRRKDFLISIPSYSDCWLLKSTYFFLFWI
jgi:hypothetical protein